MTALNRHWLLAPLLTLSAWSAHADIMDDIDVRREGNNAVVSVRMAVSVNLQRFTTSRSSDLTQAYYQVRRSDVAPAYVSGERRVVQADGLPTITISDEPVRPDLVQDTNRRLIISFGKSVKFKVRAGKGERAIEVVLEGMGAAVKSTTLSKPQAPLRPEQRYVITLTRSSDPKVGVETPVPQALQNMQVFSARRVVDGQQVYEMDLGYFATLAEAETALKLLGRFPQAVIVKLTQEGDAPAQADQSGTPGPAMADDMLQQARQAYEQQRLDDAAATLNKLLELPPSATTAEAQELLGMVRIAQGEPAKAQVEFDSYLKQFPSGPGAERVRAALAGLQAPDLKLSPTLEGAKKPEGTPTVTGSISQYYYGGQSTQESQAIRDTDGTLLSAAEIEKRRTAPISGTDQKLLSTNMDATWRSRNAERDIKLVARNQFDYNLLSDAQLKGKSRTRNRLTAAYMDYQSLTSGFRSRLGRQSAQWGGEGRYDGGQVSYVFRPKWKASAAVGMPTDKLAESKRQFYGASLDADALTPNIGASVFVMQRMIDGETDRRAAGLDLRYFSQSGSIMASTDYDVMFRKLNVASVQGLYLGESNTTVNVLVERRSLAQASLGQTLFFQFADLQTAGIQPQTVQDLKRNNYTVAQLRELVRKNTTYADHAMTSVTTPITAQWQMGLDLHLNRTGAIAPNPVLPNGQPASGLQRTVGLQAIGTNLYSARDTSVLSGSYTNSTSFTLRQMSYNNLTTVTEDWQLEPSVRWQLGLSKDPITSLTTKTTAWGPGLKASFKPRPAVTLESNLNVDYTKTVGTNQDRSTRYTYFLGYRYDY